MGSHYLVWETSSFRKPHSHFPPLILIPHRGTFVALGLRYDHHKHQAGGQVGTFKKPYFKAALFAYFAGLATTMVVMHVFKAAQPALLYLR